VIVKALTQLFPTFCDAFLPWLILELFIPPYYTISAGRLKRFKHHFCDDSDRTLWVEV